jgi:choline dehydrogenase-like flavoprotein
VIGAELRRLGLAELGPDPAEPWDGWPATLAGGWAAMGTTRMSADPRRGVVDANGRLHGLANLYATGGSVFPTGGYVNPTLTIVALAARLAAHLREEALR